MPQKVAAAGPGRRALLQAIRDRLVAELDGDAGHRGGCDCRCGVPPDARTIPTLAKELREIIRELDDLPMSTGVTELDELTAARRARQAAAAANASKRGAPGAAQEGVRRT